MAQTWRYWCTDCDETQTLTFDRVEDEYEPTVEWCRKHGNGARFTPSDASGGSDDG